MTATWKKEGPTQRKTKIEIEANTDDRVSFRRCFTLCAQPTRQWLCEIRSREQSTLYLLVLNPGKHTKRHEDNINNEISQLPTLVLWLRCVVKECVLWPVAIFYKILVCFIIQAGSPLFLYAMLPWSHTLFRSCAAWLLFPSASARANGSCELRAPPRFDPNHRHDIGQNKMVCTAIRDLALFSFLLFLFTFQERMSLEHFSGMENRCYFYNTVDMNNRFGLNFANLNLYPLEENEVFESLYVLCLGRFLLRSFMFQHIPETKKLKPE